MKTVSKDQLEPTVLRYFQEVETTGQTLVVNDDGQAVLEIRPISSGNKSTAEVLAAYRNAGPSQLPSEEELLAPVVAIW